MSPTPFRTHIRSAQADANLQSALSLNAERRHSARQIAYSSLPEPLQELRHRAHAIRAYTVDHLDELLAEFSSKAAANGWVVHTAADARQAVEIVLKIAHQSALASGKPPLVAKGKTMLGEEINLNAHLEAAGMRVVETDLGEYIVQLRGEPPAHMTTPAVHLLRSDVGRTFQEKLGLPYTEDPIALAAAARKALRQVFLEATLGVSGVNFGIAQTGGICLVTNEGNGRMVTTIPGVHVALMGIERMVPTLDDLAVMLYLLSRTATGQKLTVYTSLIHRPRQQGEIDGAEERHLVLVDNGRRVLRQSPLRQSLYCIRCGACLNECPVFRQLGGHAYVSANGEIAPYSGPIGSIVSPGLLGMAEFGHLARASSLCGACKEVCPVDIDLPRLLLRVRAGEVAIPPSPNAMAVSTPPAPNPPPVLAIGLRIFAWIADSPALFALAQRGAALLARLALPIMRGKPHPGGAWLDLPAWSGWGASREFPLPASRPFRARFSPRDVTPNEEMGGSTMATLPHNPSELGGSRAAAQPHSASIETGSRVTAAQSHPASREELISRFQSEFEAVGGHFSTCSSGELGTVLLAWLKERKINAIQAWDNEHLPPGLLAELEAAGIVVSHHADPALLLGISGCTAAIAESGTMVITSGSGKPMTASLMPDLHIAILRAEDIMLRLPQALSLREVREASNTILITGPSRSADIEMSLTIGVHGPGEVWVFYLVE